MCSQPLFYTLCSGPCASRARVTFGRPAADATFGRVASLRDAGLTRFAPSANGARRPVSGSLRSYLRFAPLMLAHFQLGLRLLGIGGGRAGGWPPPYPASPPTRPRGSGPGPRFLKGNMVRWTRVLKEPMVVEPWTFSTSDQMNFHSSKRSDS